MKLKINYADTFLSRLRGLMFRKAMPQYEGLMITPCNQIHTFNMRFAIDVVYLDKINKVIDIDEGVNPRKICKPRKQAHSVLELNSGMAKQLGIYKNVIVERKSV